MGVVADETTIPCNSNFGPSDEEVRSADLTVGCRVEIAYLRDRRVVLSYLGNNHYRVQQSQNSKLFVGSTHKTISASESSKYHSIKILALFAEKFSFVQNFSISARHL